MAFTMSVASEHRIFSRNAANVSGAVAAANVDAAPLSAMAPRATGSAAALCGPQASSSLARSSGAQAHSRTQLGRRREGRSARE